MGKIKKGGLMDTNAVAKEIGMFILAIMVAIVFGCLFTGCAAITFQSPGGYSDRSLSGIAVYPDFGGWVTGMWRRNLEKDIKK